jgi:hypothetical protein
MYAGFDAAHNRGGDAAVGSPQVLNEILIRVAALLYQMANEHSIPVTTIHTSLR